MATFSLPHVLNSMTTLTNGSEFQVHVNDNSGVTKSNRQNKKRMVWLEEDLSNMHISDILDGSEKDRSTTEFSFPLKRLQSVESDENNSIRLVFDGKVVLLSNDHSNKSYSLSSDPHDMAQNMNDWLVNLRAISFTESVGGDICMRVLGWLSNDKVQEALWKWRVFTVEKAANESAHQALYEAKRHRKLQMAYDRTQELRIKQMSLQHEEETKRLRHERDRAVKTIRRLSISIQSEMPSSPAMKAVLEDARKVFLFDSKSAYKEAGDVLAEDEEARGGKNEANEEEYTTNKVVQNPLCL